MSSPEINAAGSPLALTMGDCCGIGPEIVLRWWHEHPHARGDVVVVGSLAVMQRARAWLGLDGLTLQAVSDPAQVASTEQTLRVWEPAGLPADLLLAAPGCIDGRAGAAAARCVQAATELALQGRLCGMVTAPLHKEALAQAGIDFAGHTDMLQAWCTPAGQPMLPVRMMLANDQLKTVLVTVHCSLRQAIEGVTHDSVLQTLMLTHHSALQWGWGKPRVAVAGLNPHAGEGGRFGDEELRIIAPAIAAAQAQGVMASGPYSPDTVFMRARHAPGEHEGEFDVVVAMYHDQGLIPVKYLGLDQGVNVTLGLPFVRTSPDHGTAFDLVGSGQASAQSLAQAVRVARALIKPPGR